MPFDWTPPPPPRARARTFTQAVRRFLWVQGQRDRQRPIPEHHQDLDEEPVVGGQPACRGRSSAAQHRLGGRPSPGAPRLCVRRSTYRIALLGGHLSFGRHALTSRGAVHVYQACLVPAWYTGRARSERREGWADIDGESRAACRERRGGQHTVGRCVCASVR